MADAPTTIENSAVADMYKVGSDIVNAALAHVATLCVPGAKVLDLCAAGDAHLNAALEKVFNKAKFEKRIGFPMCVTPNHLAGNLSPTADDPDGGSEITLADGDIAKLDCAVVIDGYYSAGAATAVVREGGASQSEPLTGRAADVICAAHTAAEAAMRCMQPGSTNTQVTDIINKVAEAYKCAPVQGVLSHITKKHVIDGNKVITGHVDPEQRVEEFSFEPFEVYHLDIIMSTGDGKVREREYRSTVFRRAIDKEFQLKMRASRTFLSEVANVAKDSAFTMRWFSDPKLRMGLPECLKHGLFNEHAVVGEKPGELVAQVKYTVLVKPNGITRLTGLSAPFVKSDLAVTDQAVLDILNRSLSKKKKNKGKKGKGAAGGEAMETD